MELLESLESCHHFSFPFIVSLPKPVGKDGRHLRASLQRTERSAHRHSPPADSGQRFNALIWVPQKPTTLFLSSGGGEGGGGGHRSTLPRRRTKATPLFSSPFFLFSSHCTPSPSTIGRVLCRLAEDYDHRSSSGIFSCCSRSEACFDTSFVKVM
ncbi:unnamed protein product, partial [Musa acuminata var. zebrina]